MLVVTQCKHGKTLLDGNTSQIHKRAIYCHWRREWRSWDNQFLAFSEQVILVISPVENKERTGFLKFGVTVSFWNGRLDLGMRSHLQFLEYAWYVKVYSTWPAQWAPRNALRVFVCVDLMVALSRTDCQAASFRVFGSGCGELVLAKLALIPLLGGVLTHLTVLRARCPSRMSHFPSRGAKPNSRKR